MSNPVIRVDRLSKRYRIGPRQSFKTLRDTVAEAVAARFRRIGSTLKGRRRNEHASPGYIWALQDVSFDVQAGDTLGIIGRNGAGKSTLLKILARITEPTKGYAEIDGRVGSLLEVGTGFHPELTGRENIYLNGAILGMMKSEIARQFDEIVAFAEVERFIDTPVKHYSSGMYLRLAFAVAAHLEPEILFVDEVLAVGDAAFQKKCLGKIGEVAKQGRTVLFVSHNLTAISHVCREAIWINEGHLIARGPAREITERYIQRDSAGDADLLEISSVINDLPADPAFRLRSVLLRQERVLTTGTAVDGRPLHVEISYEVLREVSALRIYVDLCDEYGDILVRSFHDEESEDQSAFGPGSYTSTAVIAENVLAPRRYTLVVHADIHGVRNCIPDGIPIALNVIHTGRINQPYAEEPFVAKLGRILEWHTTSTLVQ